MNSKTVLALIILFIILNIGLFILLNKDNFLRLQTPPPSNSTNPSDLPTRNANDAVTLTYNFQGKIAKIVPAENAEFEIILDTYTNEDPPPFLINKNSPIFMLKNGKEETATIFDLKVGSSVDITMDLFRGKWTLKKILIQ